MITRKFIDKMHDNFDKLNYHETRSIDEEEFRTAAYKTLYESKDMASAAAYTIMIFDCLTNWKKIQTVFKFYLSDFNKNVYTNNSLENQNIKNNTSVFYLTNCTRKGSQTIEVIGETYDKNNPIIFQWEKKKFKVNKYYLMFSKHALRIFDSNDKYILNANFNNLVTVKFEDNSTLYDFVSSTKKVDVYNRGINETKKLLAQINYDPLRGAENCLIKLEVFDNNLDIDLIYAISCAMIIENSENTEAAIAFASIYLIPKK